jgi:ABC-type multidrug transport system permease subunit
MSFLRGLVTLSLKELLLLVRDPQAAALLFGMPALLVLLLSLALKDVYGEKLGAQLTVVLEVEDEGAAAQRIAESLREHAEFTLVERPAGMDDGELFRSGTARAAVRIPAGFSDDARAFFDQPGALEFGPHKIEWQTSPSLDASYRWFIEARLAITCMEMVQSELARGKAELGQELAELGGELERTGSLLEEARLQLENTAALLEGDQELLIGVATAGALEAAAGQEAQRVRAQLAQRGELPFDVAEGTQAVPPEARTRAQAIDYTAGRDPARPLPPAFAKLSRELSEARSQRRPLPTTEEASRFVAEGARAGLELFLRESRGEHSALPSPLQQTVPGWSLFAMFFIVVPLSQGLHRERAEGTLRRILALAVPRGAVLLGKLVPYWFVGCLQFGGMLAIGLWVVPQLSDLSLELGREPWVLVPITAACALAASSYGLLVASLARTPEQAAAFGATSVVILSVVSGIMVPHFLMPEVLQRVALASPLYWGQKAYLDAFLHGAGILELTTSLAALVGFALLCLAVAATRLVR